MKIVRKNTANKFLQKPALICPEEILKIVAEQKPSTENELKNIEGFTKRMFNKFGSDLIEEIKIFEQKNKQDINLPPSANETLRLMKEGYSLEAISKIRKLSETVISMHIESILELNHEFEINRLLKEDIINTINHELKKGFKNLKEIKERLPKEITYPMIRIAAAKFKVFSSLVRANKQ